MNGIVAKQGFRFQDYCVVYILLKSFRNDEMNLDHLFCENGKIDFEIWTKLEIRKYQVKSTVTINAKYINQLLKDYIYNQLKGNDNIDRKLIMIFNKEPKGSLIYLLLHLCGNKSVCLYKKITEKYINDALENIELNMVNFSYKVYSDEFLYSSIEYES
ncbi:hypothetical protein ACFL6I_23750, partial [candidate division KSB1 bacterium]